MGEETKPSETGSEKSERLHTSVDGGEPTRGTHPSKGGRRVTEPAEGKEAGRQRPTPFYTGLDWVAELARRRPNEPLTTLAHHIDLDLLREAYRHTRKNGAVGVDGRSAKEYAEALDENLADLLQRFRSGTYRAPPSRRAHIPKGDGAKTRAIGIPTFEDKVLQRAIVMVLEQVYEQEFHDGSHGFRPGRGAHTALEALWHGLMNMGGGVVLEVDIQGFFDNLDRGHLRSFLDRRVRDGSIRRTIDKWMKAGVLDEGVLMHPEKGTPQGGVISPLLANIYLHHVLDTWFEDEIKPRLRGKSFLIRYADDFVLVFERDDDASRVEEVLPKRFGKYGLTLHPDKTRKVPFGRPRRNDSGDDDGNPPGTFDFLGFTLHWGKSRKGSWVVQRRTSRKSLRKSEAAVKAWLQRYRHSPVREQHAALTQKLRGHYAYFGLTGNGRALGVFRWAVSRLWHYWLNRRSQKPHMPWDRFNQLLVVYPLPPVRVVHSVFHRAASP